MGAGGEGRYPRLTARKHGGNRAASRVGLRTTNSCFDPEIRRACEKMIQEEGGIWGALTSVDEMVRGWQAAA